MCLGRQGQPDPPVPLCLQPPGRSLARGSCGAADTIEEVDEQPV